MQWNKKSLTGTARRTMKLITVLFTSKIHKMTILQREKISRAINDIKIDPDNNIDEIIIVIKEKDNNKMILSCNPAELQNRGMHTTFQMLIAVCTSMGEFKGQHEHTIFTNQNKKQ